MPKITLLHFSDAHWHPTNSANLSIVRRAMVHDINELKKTEKISIDLVLFSGDLVLAGEEESHFDVAETEIIIPVLNATGVSRERFFICPGNHDISRKIVRDDEYIEAGIKAKLNTADAVNVFLDKLENQDTSSQLAVARTQNYNNFVKKQVTHLTAERSMVKIFKVKVGSATIGIASFDNAWRSSGEHSGDRQNLLMGERTVDFAIDQMADVDLAIALYHHPLTWLADFESAVVGPRLQKGFDILAFGHMHNAEPEVRQTVSGTAVLCQSGAMFSGRNHFNGYQILEVDRDICQVKVLLRAYFDGPTPHFSSAENIVAGGRIILDYTQDRSASDPMLERFLRSIRPIVRQLALDQFNISDIGAELCVDPHTAFICPPIYLKQDGSQEKDDQTTDELSDNEEIEKPESNRKGQRISLDDLVTLAESVLITGGRENGKTSLAHFIAVKVADGLCDKPRVPIIIDYRNFGGNLYSLKRNAASYLGLHGAGFDIEEALLAGSLLVIIDNFSGSKTQQKASLEKLVETYPKVRWILLADTRMGATNRSVENNDLIDKFVVARIDTLPRKSIRELTGRWCERTGEDKERTFSTVMRHINSSDLPRTGYIVTLLLWAIRQGDKLDRINESSLIMNMVDFLLGKANFEKSLEGEFDALSKEITLQAFARYARDSGGVVNSNEAISFLIEFFKNKGLNYDASEVLDALCQCGILVKRSGDVSFKYRCFQEYFIARHLATSDARLKEALYNRAYLSFQRELEIFAGLNRENKAVLEELSFQLKSYPPSYVAEVNMKTFDDVVDEESSVGVSRRKLRQIREKKLTAEQIDDLMDAAEAELAQRRKSSTSDSAHSKSDFDTSNSTAAVTSHEALNNHSDSVINQPNLHTGAYIATLSLLGKVVRTSEFAERSLKVDSVRLYISASAKLFVYINGIVSEMFESMVQVMNKSSDFLDDEGIRALKYYLTKRMMSISGSIVLSDIGGSKLIPIFEDILAANDISLAEKTFLSGIQLNIGNERWVEHWSSLAKESKRRRIAVEFLVDKLWSHIHEKVLTASERRIVEKMAADLEIVLGAPKQTKSRIMEKMKAVTEKSARDNEEDL